MKHVSILASFIFAISTTHGFAADAASGESIFNKKCASCHMVGPDAKASVGPALNNIVGNPVASIDGYKYSMSLKELAANGAVWSEAELDKWLIDQKKYVQAALDNKKAKSKMNFKLKKEDERADIIAYLATLTE